MAISKKSWLGFGVETVPGTALATPTVFYPCKSTLKGTKKTEPIKDERGNRDAIYGMVETTREGSIDPKGAWYNDTSPYLILAALGSVTTAQPDATNVPTVRKHTFSLADIPKTLTMFKSYDAVVYLGAYSALEKFTLKISEGKTVEADASFKHLYPVKYTGAPITPTFSNVQPFASYLPKITLSGIQSNDIEDLQIDFSQKITMFYPANGVPDFTTIYFGEREAKVDFTARFDNDTVYQRFLNRVDDSLTVDIQGALIGKLNTVTVGAASAGTFTLTYGGQTTTPIAYNATSAIVQTALIALTSIGAGNVVVTGAGPYTVSFLTTALNDNNTLTGTGTGLTGGAFAVGVQTSYAQEMSFTLSQIHYDSMDHDTGKDNILIKAKATAISNGTNPLITAFVQNTVTSYAL